MSLDLIRPSPHFKTFAAAALPLNCLGAESIKPAAGTHPGTPCRMLRAIGAGTITVKRASDGTSDALTFGDGEKQEVMCNEITSVVGVTSVTVYW